MKDPVTDPFKRVNPSEEYKWLRARYTTLMAMELTVDDFYFGVWMRAMGYLLAEIKSSGYTLSEVTR